MHASSSTGFFQGGDLKVVELTADVIEVATQLRAHYALMTPDALQLASAMSLGDDYVFVTNDKRLRKVQGVHIEIIA
jgi:uncharacterized protein